MQAGRKRARAGEGRPADSTHTHTRTQTAARGAAAKPSGVGARPAATRGKAGRAAGASGDARKKARAVPAALEVDVSSDDAWSDAGVDTHTHTGGGEDEVAAMMAEPAESADAYRVRMAKEMLARATAAVEAEAEAAGESVDEDGVAAAVDAKLKDDLAATAGRLFRPVGRVLATVGIAPSCYAFKRGHSLSTTCVAVNRDGSAVFTGSKDCTIIRWTCNPTALAIPSDKLTEGDAAAAASSAGPASSAAAFEVQRLQYPGRRRTKTDVEVQRRIAAAERKKGMKGSRPVVSSGYGGGRIGSTTDSKGALARLSSTTIIHQEGTSTIIVPASQLSSGKRGPAAGATDAETLAHDPVAKLRSVEDYRIAGHFAEILAIALSPDGKYLASGGKDRFVRVWNAESETPDNIENFVGHKDSVTALSFRKSAVSHVLYSGSADRCVKLWGLDEMAYVDTLFGHQAPITALDALAKERCVTVSDDRTARYWKIPEQSQLVFRAHASDVTTDAIACINDAWFVSGAADGSLSLWHTAKKKPTLTVPAAHGNGVTMPTPTYASAAAAAPASAELAAAVGMDEEDLITARRYCNWITALAHVPNSDLVVSGSGDGYLRFWRLSHDEVHAPASAHPSKRDHEGLALEAGGAAAAAIAQKATAFRSLVHVAAVPVKGVVNGISVSGDGSFVAAAVGQEPRLGKWWRYKRAHNGVLFVRLPTMA